MPNNLDNYGSLPWLPVGYFFRGSAAEGFTLFSEMLIDEGVASFILFLYILIGFIVLLHPFKHKSGEVFGYIYFISWGLVILGTYFMDILFVMSIQYRVYGSKLLAILANSGQKKIFLSQIAIIPALGAVFW